MAPRRSNESWTFGATWLEKRTMIRFRIYPGFAIGGDIVWGGEKFLVQASRYRMVRRTMGRAGIRDGNQDFCFGHVNLHVHVLLTCTGILFQCPHL